MPIALLPQTAVRAIGSISALSDPCSVTKELIDNSLDASATSISVEISSNALDIIQVKDNGYGVPPGDRELLCKANFTSKIRTLEDLRNIGGKTLGFRGAALAGIAEMSGGLLVTTKVDGEVVAAAMKYGRTGELMSTDKISHARGTTVRVSNFLNDIPVRKQMALKMSSKTIVTVKKMLQTYALARPAVRLSLKILKSKSDAGNWVYGPTPKAGIADAAYKVAGPDVAAQCIIRSWPSEDVAEKGDDLANTTTDDEPSPNCRLVAYLPSSNADFQKASRAGQYISIDGRPVSTSKGLSKDIVKSFKSYLRSFWARQGSEATFSDTFLCLHIYCPIGSYDVNIEPSKDEVLFEDSSAILSLADAMFSELYGEITPDGSSAKQNAKQAVETSRQGNAFDILLAKKPTPARPTPEKRRPSAVEYAVANEEIKSRRYSHRSAVDDIEAPHEKHSIPTTPWTRAKGNIGIRSPVKGRPDTSPWQQQQLPTPARERSSPTKLFPTPSDRPIPALPHRSRVDYSSPEATPLAAKGSGPKDLNSSVNWHAIDQEPISTRRGYGDEAIATWARDTGQYVDDSRPFSDIPTDNGEVTRETVEPGPERENDFPGRTSEKSTVTGGLGKSFKLPVKQIQKSQQYRVSANEREDTTQTMGDDEDNYTSNDRDPRREYPEFERASTLLRDPSKEPFPTQLDVTLDGQRRKKAVNQRMKNQPKSQSTLHFQNTDSAQDLRLSFQGESNESPHKNRYLAAKAALAARESELVAEQGKEKTEVQSRGLDHEDPRAYFIRNRDKIQGPANTKSGLQIRRIQTRKLPLESIPVDCELHHLISTCSVELKTISSLNDKLRKADTYISNGAIAASGCGFTELSQNELASWESKLGDLLRQKYRTDHGNIPNNFPMDFKLSDGETYGFV